MAAITGLAHRLGALTPLTEVVDPALTPEVAQRLLDRGQRMCAVAGSAEQLINESVTGSLDSARLTAADIDRVILTSESILIAGSKKGHESVRAGLYGTLAELGLGHCPVLMMTFAGCSSAVAALEYATQLVGNQTSANVLVIAADRVIDAGGRVLPPAISVVGDGVASCVVTGGPAECGYTLRWVRRRGFLTAVRHDRGIDFGPALVLLGRALASVGREVRDSGPVLDEAVLACNNYGLPTLRMFGRTLGVPDGHVFTDNVGAIGHLGSPDPLVNLATLPRSRAGALLLATGPGDCALAFLTPEAGR